MECKVYDDMIGHIFTSVVHDTRNKEIIFTEDNGKKFIFYHSQDCCEDVCVEDIVGDLNDLVGEPLLEAEMVTDGDTSYGCWVERWTFYKFATINSRCTIRWYGVSNGCYSTSVSRRIETPGEATIYGD